MLDSLLLLARQFRSQSGRTYGIILLYNLFFDWTWATLRLVDDGDGDAEDDGDDEHDDESVRSVPSPMDTSSEDFYERERDLGEGGLDEEGADSEAALSEFRTEVELMKSLDHPSICRLLQVYEDPKNLYLVMEHIQGGELPLGEVPC
ncbi:Calcium-dependent protein kinase 3 [Symbiodinium microadriaticum]|uniref:Calcium-dependent protein kinase 3 n=1 Tax=Symbiodinium microadriaticum TaxID=2951 RepID=A0A1Q9DAI9_SYMMI|nr:Calcium-dependent protein kinase 3 [Symbiodinium microadriaticum]